MAASRILGATLTLIAILLGASAARAEPLPWRIKNVQQAAPGQSLVVGSIRYFKDGDETKKCSDGGAPCDIIILPPGTSKAVVWEFSRSGDFTWSLPPGQYIVLAIARMDVGWNIKSMRGVFTVPADGRPIYIGELLFGVKGYRYAIGLHDGFEKAASLFDAAHPDKAGTLAKALLKPEEDGATFSGVTSICAEEWRITCTKNFTGVTPVLPSDGTGFTAITTRQPQFRWGASADSAVTYDLTLYEAATFNDDGWYRQYVEGRMIAYRQGLTKPEWQPEEQLEAGRRFYWSVRLRKGDIVSTWSTYSYSHFFLIGFSSGWGQWFKFATPPLAKTK